MRTNPFATRPVGFTAALSSRQEAPFQRTLEQVKQVIGSDGISAAEIYLPALPTNDETDNGIGHFNSEDAQKLWETLRTYCGVNMIKTLPIGQLTDKGSYNDQKKPGAYERSAFAIGEDHIDLSKLTTKKWGNLLPERMSRKFVYKHLKYNNDEHYIDFDKTLGWENQEDYPINEFLQVAWDNFKNRTNPTPELEKLREEFKEFKHKKHPVDLDDIYTKCAIWPWLKDPFNGRARNDMFFNWSQKDYKDYLKLRKQAETLDENSHEYFEIRRKVEHKYQKYENYENIRQDHLEDIEFYKFKQFLARKTIEEGIEMAHEKGLKVYADAPVGFSWIEQNIFADAFVWNQDHTSFAEIGWGIPALDSMQLMYGGPARDLLKAKISMLAELYDGLRMDVGWSYIRPAYFENGERKHPVPNGTTKITNFIEEVVREVKGKEFDNRTILYECDADKSDFDPAYMRDYINNLDGLPIFSTENEHNEYNGFDQGWANYKYLTDKCGIRRDRILLIPNNHDGKGVLNCAKNKKVLEQQVGALIDVFGLEPDSWTEFKDSGNDEYQNKIKITKGRFTEVSLAKNQGFLLDDLFGRETRIDYHTARQEDPNSEKDYKSRYGKHYIEHFHHALQAGLGYNIAEVYLNNLVLTNKARLYPELCKKLENYSAYLKMKGPVSKQQADSSKNADFDIEHSNLDRIYTLDFSA